MTWLDPKKVLPKPEETVIVKLKNSHIKASRRRYFGVTEYWSGVPSSYVIGWMPLEWLEDMIDG